jgi:RNA polymerase sigma factor (sigma-70 family)
MEQSGTPTQHTPSIDELRHVVDNLARVEGWSLAPAGVEALAVAILPHVQALAEPSEAMVTRIALNYFLDGPMLQMMRTPTLPESERLWSDWRSYMLSLARARHLTDDQAEELAQETYLQTSRVLANFHFHSRLKSFFCGIFINCYRHWVRRRQTVARREESLPAPSSQEDEAQPMRELADNAPAPEEQVLDELQNGQLRERVAQEIQKIISSQDYQILYLYYVEQRFTDATAAQRKWTDKEIGEHLGMPLNTVTSRRLRTLQRLQRNKQLRAWLDELVNRSIPQPA